MDKWSCTLLAFACAALASVAFAPRPAPAATFDAATRVRVEGDQVFARRGISVASAGDVNGDNYGDVIVGAGGYDDGQAEEGAAFLFLGSASGVATAGATIHLAPEPHAAALTLCSGLALGAVARRRSSLHAGRAVRYLSNP
jgi:hypothetical protein